MKSAVPLCVFLLIFSSAQLFSQTSYIGVNYGIGRWNFYDDSLPFFHEKFVDKIWVNSISSYSDIGIHGTIEIGPPIVKFDLKLNNKHRANKDFSINYLECSTVFRLVFGKKLTATIGYGPSLLVKISDKGSVNYFYDNFNKKLMFGLYGVSGIGYKISKINNFDLLITNAFDLTPMFTKKWIYGVKEDQYGSSMGLELRFSHKIDI